MMCNTNKLAGAMREKGFTQETLAQAANISRATLARRMKKGEDFTIKEINNVTIALHLSSKEAVEIFLCQDSLTYETKEKQAV